MSTTPKLILASASPRRHEILSSVHFAHEILVSDADETLPDGISPAEAVKMLSEKKAMAVQPLAPPDSIVLAADTVVALDGAILGKPADADDARRMLASLSGKTHAVLTGVTLTDGTRTVTDHAETTVRMKALTAAEIDAYVASGEPLDKAGAYGIQERAAIFVDRIEGDYFNIVGLPIRLVASLLEGTFGICPAMLFQ